MIDRWWVDEVAATIRTWGPPGCVLCDASDASQVGGSWVCSDRVCRALAPHVRTMGDLVEARAAVTSSRNAT